MNVRKYLSCLENFFLTGPHRLFNMRHPSRRAKHGIMTKLSSVIFCVCIMGVLSPAAQAQFRPIGSEQGSMENTPIEQQNDWLPQVQTPQAEVATPELANIVIQQPLPQSEAVAPVAPTATAVEAIEIGNLWDRIRAGLKLSELKNPRVASHEAAFASEPEYLARIVDRSRRYLHHIVVEVEKRGMPMEIALLPIVESAFNPKAYSSARASGIWQFMPGTGKNYGLQQNWWQDERRDVHAATTAALDYLASLHRRFNNWELALASYNSGEGRVGRAIAYNRTRGLPTDFSSIQLPTETRNYVPKLIAVRNIVREPERFGLTLAYIPDKPYFIAVSTHKHIDLKRAAEFAEIPVDEFLALNPAFNRPVIAAKESRSILVPAETADIFLAKLENPDQPLVSWRTQKLARGEALEKVADRFGISSSELKEINGIPSSKTIAGGGMVLVPMEAAQQHPSHFDQDATPEAAVAAPYIAPPGFSHTVKSGESLGKIARRYGVSAKSLQAWNGLRKGRVVVGQRLTIHQRVTQVAAVESKARKGNASKSGDTRSYRVQRGDTLYSIARRFDVDITALRRVNNISETRGLLSGMRVAIPAQLKS